MALAVAHAMRPVMALSASHGRKGIKHLLPGCETQHVHVPAHPALPMLVLR
jgi:hypothetical protein